MSPKLRIPLGLIVARRLLLKHLLGGGATGALSPALPFAKIQQLVSGHCEQPGSERTAGGVILEPAGGARHAAQDFLGEIGRIGVLKLASPGVAVHHGRVNPHQLPPGLGIAGIAQADEQTRPGGRPCTHGPPRTAGITTTGAESFRKMPASP